MLIKIKYKYNNKGAVNAGKCCIFEHFGNFYLFSISVSCKQKSEGAVNVILSKSTVHTYVRTYVNWTKKDQNMFRETTETFHFV